MKDDEKHIQIRLQNDNCMIYLKGNESSMTEKNKKSTREEILNDDDMKELSLSISNISEFNSNKRKINLKNYNSIEKTENEISELSIFNSNIKQEDIIPKTPIYELKNESTNNNNLRKEKNNPNFKEELKSKNLVIKKLNFDSAECDTIQETDTIKKLDSKEKTNDKDNNSNNDSEEKINIENINKNLHKQFFSQDENNKNNNKEEDNIKIENKDLCGSSKKEMSSNKDIIDNIISEVNLLDKNENITEYKFEKEGPKINNSNINNIKNELISTTKYKQKCIEKYCIELKKPKCKTIIQNKIFDLKCRSFSRQKKENNKILSINTKQIKLKENLLNAQTKESKDKKTLIANDGINNIIYIKNMKSKNSFYKKRSISNWSRTKNINLIKTLNQENTISKKSSYPIKSSFLGNKNIKNNINNKLYLSNLNNYIINNRNCENAIFLTNNNYNTNLFCTCFSTNNIFIKKNASDYNNYYNQISKSKKIIQVGNNYNKFN